MVEGFAAGFGGFEGDGELLLGFGLADELGEAFGAEFELDGVIVVEAAGGDEAVGLGGVGGLGRGGAEADLSLVLEIHAEARIRRSGRGSNRGGVSRGI